MYINLSYLKCAKFSIYLYNEHPSSLMDNVLLNNYHSK